MSWIPVCWPNPLGDRSFVFPLVKERKRISHAIKTWGEGILAVRTHLVSRRGPDGMECVLQRALITWKGGGGRRGWGDGGMWEGHARG